MFLVVVCFMLLVSEIRVLSSVWLDVFLFFSCVVMLVSCCLDVVSSGVSCLIMGRVCRVMRW